MSLQIPAKELQIDVKGPHEKDPNYMECRLYYDGRCVRIIMSKYDYEELMRDGLFIRNGLANDSAGVINTTKPYVAVHE